MMSKESRDRLISVAVALLIVLVVWFGKWCASNLESSQSLFCGGMTCKMPNTVQSPDRVQSPSGAVASRRHR